MERRRERKTVDGERKREGVGRAIRHKNEEYR